MLVIKKKERTQIKQLSTTFVFVYVLSLQKSSKTFYFQLFFCGFLFNLLFSQNEIILFFPLLLCSLFTSCVTVERKGVVIDSNNWRYHNYLNVFFFESQNKEDAIKPFVCCCLVHWETQCITLYYRLHVDEYFW